MNDSATDATYPDPAGDQPRTTAANSHSVKASANNDGSELESIRRILLEQFAAEQSRKLAGLRSELFERLDQHMLSVNTRLDTVEQSMDKHRLSAQESDEKIREQLINSIDNTNNDLSRSKEMVQAQLAQIQEALNKSQTNKKMLSKMLKDLAEKLNDGTS